MEKIRSTNKTITSLTDLGRLFGFGQKVTPGVLSKSLLRETNYDVEMEIAFSDKTERCDEAWQIELTRCTHQTRVRMRPAGRGRWMTRPDEVPSEPLRFIHADRGETEEIISRRSWGAWQRGRWMRPGFRRHRSKANAICFSMTMAGIERKTGERLCHVALSVFGAEGDQAGRVELTMPFKASDLIQAVSEVRSQSAVYFLEAAA